MLLFIFAGTLALRIYLALMDDVITSDGLLYINNAKLIQLGQWKAVFERSFIHIYPLLILLSHKIVADWELAARAVSVLTGSLAVIPLFLLARGMFGIRIAIVSSIFYMINPKLAEYSSQVLREPAFWCFSITALWLAWKSISERRIFYMVLSSIFTGLSMFERLEGIGVAIIILLWNIWYFLQVERDRRRLILFPVIFICAMPVLFSPFLIFLAGKLERWIFGLASVGLPSIMRSKGDLDLSPELMKMLPRDMNYFLELAINNRYTIFFSEIIFKIIKSMNVMFALLACVGFFKAVKSVKNDKKQFLIVAWFGIFFLIALLHIGAIYYLSTRHGLLMGIPALIWAGMGFYEVRDFIRAWLNKRQYLQNHIKYMTVVLILIIVGIVFPKTLCLGVDRSKAELKQAGRYLKNMGYSQTRFTGDVGLARVVFYADAEFIVIPPGLSMQNAETFIRQNNIRYMIINQNRKDTLPDYFTQEFDGLTTKRSEHPELNTYKNYRICIYRINSRN